ncbi:VOC family protein [Mangrovihabitans endophyticus]|uniref:Hydroxylase n=1 Tax=Mangrovihabitans endophyticus TaxID=1751298 RepID=A0A8J3BWX9_9ACTN|nr:VOC family protein [Mangrovihabitans endophyticus]GGK85235.1 hydroxylase [Mangrovihabitans endophyticus]
MRIRGFAPSTPCWVELASADPGRAQDFYASLFGWEPAGDRFKLDGRAAAGLTRARPGRPAGWVTYLSVEDLGASVHQFAAAGGRCLSGPTDGHGGQGAIVSDPSGAVLGLWQPGDFAGTQVGGEPGTMAWPELLTADPQAAAEFYGRACGWTLRDEVGSHGGRGEWLTAAHNAMAGIAPGGRTAWWRCSFQVADCDAAVENAMRLGGRVVVEPTDMGIGSYAELRDPFGAAFAVTAPSTQPVELTLAFSDIAGMELTFPG